MPSPLWALSPPLPHPPGRSLLMPFEDHGDLEPLELVWAKCRGYPSYPALVSLPQTTPSCSLSPWRLWPLPCLGGVSDWMNVVGVSCRGRAIFTLAFLGHQQPTPLHTQKALVVQRHPVLRASVALLTCF